MNLRTAERVRAFKAGEYPYNASAPAEKPMRIRERLANVAIAAAKLAGMPAKKFDAAFVAGTARQAALWRVETAIADLDAIKQRLVSLKAGDE